jgi:hypothetical protein
MDGMNRKILIAPLAALLITGCYNSDPSAHAERNRLDEKSGTVGDTVETGAHDTTGPGAGGTATALGRGTAEQSGTMTDGSIHSTGIRGEGGSNLSPVDGYPRTWIEDRGKDHGSTPRETSDRGNAPIQGQVSGPRGSHTQNSPPMDGAPLKAPTNKTPYGQGDGRTEPITKGTNPK